MFEFNRDYEDLEQVAEFFPEYLSIREEIEAAGGFPYNECFKGRIPGIANPEQHSRNSGSHEDAAIYLLQRLYRAKNVEAQIAAAIEEGHKPIERVDGPTKFASIIVYDREGWQQFHEARLVPEQNPVQAEYTGQLAGVLPKGKRTRGYRIEGKKVLAK
jgi:hypothetical protein